MTAHRDFAVAAPNYGRLPEDLSVLDRACPIVASYGARDRALKGEAARLAAALTERGIRHDVKEYPGAGHSFLDRFHVGPFTPLLHVAGLGYDQPSAEDAWRRILRFFAEQLQTAPDHRAGKLGLAGRKPAYCCTCARWFCSTTDHVVAAAHRSDAS